MDSGESLRAKMAGKQRIVKAFIIRINSGEYEGRYIGMRFDGGLVANLEIQNNPPVNPPGLKYSLWVQEESAIRFFERNAEPALKALNELGYKVGLIKVQG
jgi:hypothetical protein